MERRERWTGLGAWFVITLGVAPGVLLADVVRLGVAAAVAGVALEQFERDLKASTTATPRTLPATPASRDAQRFPAYPAPSSSVPVGQFACSNGRIVRRLSNGWEDVSYRDTRRPAECRVR